MTQPEWEVQIRAAETFTVNLRAVTVDEAVARAKQLVRQPPADDSEDVVMSWGDRKTVRVVDVVQIASLAEPDADRLNELHRGELE